jgi:hypothetical protein
MFPGSSMGASFHFAQTNWGSLTANTASHLTDQSGWTQYGAKDAGITTVNGGADVQLQQVPFSTSQTTDTDFNTNTTKTNTATAGSGVGAGVELDKSNIAINEYTVGKLVDVAVTVTAVNQSGPWLLTLSGTPNLSRIFKNDEFTDSAGKKWKVLSLNPSTTTPRLLVWNSEANTGAPATGVGHVGRWYTDLSAWETGRQGDLVARNAIERALPYYDVGPDTNSLVISGWSVDANHYVEVYVPPSERHRGKAGVNNYVMNPSGTADAINISVPYTIIDGLEITDWGAGGGFSSVAIYINANNATIKNNIIHDYVAGNGGNVIYNQIGTSGHRISNNIIYGASNGLYIDTSPAVISYVFNNTVYNMTGKCYWSSNNSALFKNNIAQSCGDGFNGSAGGSNYNISDLATDAPGANSKNLITVSFVDATNKDFHLAFNDTSAKNAGVDLSADANLPIATDIDGDARTGTWDIGADDVGATYVRTSSIGTASRDFATMQAWEDARDGVLTTRNVFKTTTQSGAFTAGETITGATSGKTGTYIAERAVPSASETYMTLRQVLSRLAKH